jgi:hypothetical protein
MTSNDRLVALKRLWERIDRLAFRGTVLIALFGFSIGPIVHREPIAQVLGVCASLALTCLAAGYLFSVRRT